MVSAKGMPTVAFGSYTHPSRVTWVNAGACRDTRRTRHARKGLGRRRRGRIIFLGGSRCPSISLYLYLESISIGRTEAWATRFCTQALLILTV